MLDGALALAIPTTYGQSLSVEPIKEPVLTWQSYDAQGNLWLEAQLILTDGPIKASQQGSAIVDKLMEILTASKRLNPNFLSGTTGAKVTTRLDFPLNWGLGTSSTLITNLAQWAQIDPYKLLDDTFGGSGYDIACAMHNSPLTYQIKNGERIIIETAFEPGFKEHLYFVFLNKKQNSRDGIATYRKNKSDAANAISEINAITQDLISCSDLKTFQFLMQSHEAIIANIMNQKPVKEMLFKNFKGSIKSLGAWGGDFVLVASEENPESYFKEKGFPTLIRYADMVL